MKKIFFALFFIPFLSFAQTFHLLDSVITYSSANNSLYSKSEYSFDSNNITLKSYFYWDLASSAWIENAKNELTYDANGNKTLDVIFNWDLASSSWIGTYKYEYTYDANNNQILYSNYTWDLASSAWIGNYKYEYTYDANNNQILYSNYTWDLASSSWIIIDSCYSDFSSTDLCENAFPANYNSQLDLPANISHSTYIGAAYSVPNAINIPSYTNCSYNNSFYMFFYYSNTLATFEDNQIIDDTQTKKIVRITDLLGRDINAIKNKILFYIYDDGRVEKKIIIE